MSQATHHETAPEDRIPLPHKLMYGLGALVNNMLAASIGGMLIVLNLGLGMNPALVGLLGALPRLTDAITDPLMGYISESFARGPGCLEMRGLSTVYRFTFGEAGS